nr:transposase [Microbispora sp. H11081]
MCKIRSGATRRDIPARYGSWQKIYTRFRRWALDGTFTRMLQASADARGAIDWLVAADSTIVRAHQHAAEANKGDQAPVIRPIRPSDNPEAD